MDEKKQWFIGEERAIVKYFEGKKYCCKNCINCVPSYISDSGYVCTFGFHIPRNSLNALREVRLYKWKEDRDGKLLNEPVKKFDHFWDAVRYGRQGIDQDSHEFFMVG